MGRDLVISLLESNNLSDAHSNAEHVIHKHKMCFKDRECNYNIHSICIPPRLTLFFENAC